MSAQKKSDLAQKGIAPIFIVLVICFFFLGLILWNRNLLGFKFLSDTKQTPAQTATTQSTPTAPPKKLSLKETCLSELRSVPKPSFKYQLEDGPVGTLQPLYKKERFSGVKNIYSCYTSYMFNRVIEQAYTDMGAQYYETDKYGNKYIKPGQNAVFEKAVYNSLTNSFQNKGWKQTSQYNEKGSSGLPVMILTKNQDDREYFIDIGYSGMTGVAFSYIITVMEK